MTAAIVVGVLTYLVIRSPGTCCCWPRWSRRWLGEGKVGLRFIKRIRLSRGLTVNLSRGGASLSMGRRGAHVTLGTAGMRETVGLPGTGVSYTTAHRWRHRARRHGPNVLGGLLGLALIWAIIRTLAGG